MNASHPSSNQLIFRVVVVVSVMIIIALIHAFRLGSYLDGRSYTLYYSYASDLMLPFGVYCLLCLNELYLPFLRNWIVKSIIVFLPMIFSEVVQYFDIYFFGTTFDPVDILMFAMGILIAVFVDRLVLARFFPLWNYKE